VSGGVWREKRRVFGMLLLMLSPMVETEPIIGKSKVSYTSFLKQSTSEPIRRKFDEVIFKEDEAWERS
jgi:hypothetical protein